MTPPDARAVCGRCQHPWSEHARPDEIAGCRHVTHGFKSATLCNCLERDTNDERAAVEALVTEWCSLFLNDRLPSPTLREVLISRLTACLLAFAAAAVKERDFQWWEAIACVDNVPPTPEGCKWWVINTQEHWVKEARAEEREAWIEYTQFVRDANDAWIVLAHVHGMRASAETVQMGKEMRAALGVEWEGGKLVDIRARREGPDV